MTSATNLGQEPEGLKDNVINALTTRMSKNISKDLIAAPGMYAMSVLLAPKMRGKSMNDLILVIPKIKETSCSDCKFYSNINEKGIASVLTAMCNHQILKKLNVKRNCVLVREKICIDAKYFEGKVNE